MDNIPEDITKAARRVYDALGRGSVSDSEHIARALLAQDRAATERAAKIAELFIIEKNSIHPDVPFEQLSEQTRNVAHMTCQHIAAAIRQP